MKTLFFRSSLFPLLIVCLGVALLGIPLANTREELYEMRRQRAAAMRLLNELKEERERFLDERTRLLTEPSAIERVAREQYGFVAPGEYPVEIETGIEKRADRPSIKIPSDGWDWILGRGGYPWRLPLCAVFVGAVVLAALELVSDGNDGMNES